MNARSTISSKGQVVVPKAIRDAEGWVAGTEVEFIKEHGDVIMRPARTVDPRFPPVTWEEVRRRRIKYDGPPVSLEDMETAVLEEAARRWDEKNR